MTMLSTSDVNPRRPPRHRRGHSLPAQLPSTILLPQVPQVARRHSIANPVTLDGLRTEIGVAWRMLSDVDAKLHETVQRIADMVCFPCRVVIRIVTVLNRWSCRRKCMPRPDDSWKITTFGTPPGTLALSRLQQI